MSEQRRTQTVMAKSKKTAKNLGKLAATQQKPTDAEVENVVNIDAEAAPADTPASTTVEAEPITERPTTTEPAVETASVKADTHSSRRKVGKIDTSGGVVRQTKWAKIAGLAAGGAALLALLVSGVSSQYFKNKVMPSVSVAGVSSSAKTETELRNQLEAQKKQLSVTFTTKDKTLKPSLEEIGYQVDVSKTIDNALNAKRRSGIFTKLAFWQHVNVPAVVSVNNTLLNQYLETNIPGITKTPTDAQLEFNVKDGSFNITNQADGQGPDITKLKQQLVAVASNLKPAQLSVGVAKRGPSITEAQLQPLVAPANELVSKKIVLTGLGYTYRAKPADIAAWITPTPQSDGSVKLVVDSAKVQSYVESVGKKISSPPQDKKVVTDASSGAEVVLQQGRDGTELADRQTLANAIAQALKNKQDTTQTMNITTAAYKTVNMEAYDKWIEVDLSEQRTTAYERATPVRSFVVATGTRGHETPIGEYAIWLRVRSQTMQGGSKADGSYYSIPNVEWVSYFYKDYALHGAWWREVFGYPASHGCVNMTNGDAQWVYEWAPLGTKVIVHA